jgi:microcystin-dependent protein
MKRIDTATKATDLFGAGKHGFKDGDLSIGIYPTDLDAEWFNDAQEEIANVIEGAGVVLNGAIKNQMFQAIALLIAEKAVRPGAIVDYGGATAPAGYLACPTAPTNLSRVTYAAMFAEIGIQWGAGDGVTTFGMPFFPANYAAVQASGNVGTQTVGAVIAHVHGQTATGTGGASNMSQLIVGALGSEVPLNNSTNTTGGSANLAAGSRVLKCVKY